jgi:membrane protease YdiL (CAAX protease family)
MTTTSLVPDASSSREPRTAVAPWWHTILLIAIIAGFSVLEEQFRIIARASILPSRVPLYAAMLCYELFLFAYVWLLGLRPHEIRIREIIGGRWNRFRDFLIDLAVAFLFWMVVIAALAVVRYMVRYNGIEAAMLLLPRSVPEVVTFLVLSVTAGFCEEFVCRGYLQRQFLTLMGRAWIAISAQALVFGAGHLYQGWRGVLALTVYGALFGILARRRNSLRPGMMQHAAQDSLSGIIGMLIRHRIV